LNQLKDAGEIKAVLQRTGWLDERANINPHSDIAEINPTSHLPPPTWKAILQQKKQNVLDSRVKSIQTNAAQAAPESFTADVVKVIDKSYLDKRYHTTKHNNLMDTISQQHTLNEEQERAFRIIANHIVMPNSEPLKMYIGGMGGTGKSQVLKAVSDFFESRNEAYRFVVVAPTGTAAALLSGSTYHSVFGINDMSSEAQATKTLMQVRTRLLGVDYIFLDEVSMLSCHDIYKISAQMCKVMNQPTLPFGGLNFLFAGDFAQLPPPVGGENVSSYSRRVGISRTHKKAQEDAMGRALWHQVTTVVVLRQNMRQKTQSKDDDKLRQALENMRYKDCTLADIQFLRSRITSQLPGRPSITDDNFKFVSIIIAKNVQKDEINRLGCQMFAQHTGQKLVDFYSEDSLKPSDDLQRRKKGKAKTLTKLNAVQQKLLWNLSHSTASKPVPGKLSICLGLPIMIKCNVATELCITNGQEGTIAGWQSTVGQHNQQVLDVLFVKLKAPPKPVQIEGLPENVVPLTRSSVSITCKLPDGGGISISRSQVEVLPNFAMTDFASQGKTRPCNPVDLNNCRSHQSYYTALSRSSTAKGTIILQGFDAKKITGRASGALRQEFRDLELLDEITNLRYLGKLPSSVNGDRRNELIHTFRLHKGINYVPRAVHHSIKWSKKDPMLDPIADNLPWEIVKTESAINKTSKTEILKNLPVTPLKSSKRKEITPEKEHRIKINKTNLKDETDVTGVNMIDVQSLMPRGTIWSQNSCAYDAVLCIMHSIWSSNKTEYTEIFRNFNDILGNLALNFIKHASGSKTLESTRDDTRRYLNRIAPSTFKWGQFTSALKLIEYVLTMPTIAMHNDHICKNGHISRTRRNNNTSCLLSMGTHTSTSVADWMEHLTEQSNATCASCSEIMDVKHQFLLPLPFIALDFARQELQISHTFSIEINNQECVYKKYMELYIMEIHILLHI
jgi:hypothetical protein